MQSFWLLYDDETSMVGMIVSAIANRVIHWASVRTSPAGGGGRGVSSGLIRFSCVLVIVGGTGCRQALSMEKGLV